MSEPLEKEKSEYCSETLQARVTKEQMEWLIHRADQCDSSISAVIRNLINQELKLEAVIEKEAPCDHSDVEDMHCLDCGKDLTEEIMSHAFDRAKDLAKYGE